MTGWGIWLKGLQWRMILIRGAVILVTLAGFVSAIWIHGYKTAANQVKEQYLAELREKQDEIQDLDQEIFTMTQAMDWERKQRSIAAKELDDAALQNPDFSRPGIGTDGMQFLSDHWTED